jgi:hypothetical protein
MRRFLGELGVRHKAQGTEAKVDEHRLVLPTLSP